MMKKALCVLLCAALLLGLPLAVSAEEETDFSWSLEGNVLCISGEIETQEVYPWADGADSVTTLRISEGVTEIPAGAFQNFLALQYVTIPKTLRYIGSSAFENCALLRWVRMPDGLVGIGEKAFAGCTKLAPVYLPESVAWIGDRAFDVSAVLNCYAGSAGQDYVADNGGTYRQTGTHTLASAKGTWGDAGTWTLENGALVLSGSGAIVCGTDGRYPWDAYRADIQTVELGEGITELGKDAFALCRKLVKLSFPKSIEDIADSALDGRVEVVGFTGTAAETFAQNRGLSFTAVETAEETGETETIAAETEATEAPAPEETENSEGALTEMKAGEETAPTETAGKTEPEATEAAPTEAAEEPEPTGTEAGEKAEPGETEPAEQESAMPTETEPEKEPVLTVETVTAQPGQTVKLTISLSENPGLCGLYFGIDYDHSKLTLEDYNCPNKDFVQGDWMLGVGQEERAVWLQPDLSEAEGEILTLTFRVASDAGTGDIEVALTDIAGVDDQANSVRVAGNAGGITIALGVPGDINGDGDVTSADLLRLRRYLAGQNVTAETGNADLNGDGCVDLLDLMLLQRLLTTR